MKILNLSLIALLSTQCSIPKEEEEEFDKNDVKTVIPDVGNIIIDLPTSISAGGAGLKLSDDEGVKGFFLIPVTYTGLAKDMTSLAKGLVEVVFGKAVCTDEDTSNDLENCADYTGLIAGTVSEDATVLEIPDDNSGNPRFVKYWRNPDGFEYDIGVEFYYETSDGYFAPLLELQLSKTGEQLGKGEFKFFPSFDSGEGLESIVTSFSATSEKKTLDVEVYFATPLEGGPSSLGLAVTEKDGILTGAGTAIRAQLDSDEGPFAPFQKKAEYAFVWTLAADTTNNIAVEKLAAVDAFAYGDSEAYFTNYGVDTILKNFALDLLRTSASGFDCATLGSFLDSSLPSDICTSNTAVTDTQVLNGLKNFCVADPTNGLCAIAGQVSVWANPVYMDSNGYVGNEVYNKPTDSSYAPLVTALDAVKVFTPSAFKLLGKPPVPAAVDSVN